MNRKNTQVICCKLLFLSCIFCNSVIIMTTNIKRHQTQGRLYQTVRQPVHSMYIVLWCSVSLFALTLTHSLATKPTVETRWNLFVTLFSNSIHPCSIRNLCVRDRARLCAVVINTTSLLFSLSTAIETMTEAAQITLPLCRSIF